MKYYLVLGCFVFWGSLLDCTQATSTGHKEDITFTMEGPVNRSKVSQLFNIDSLELEESRYYSVSFFNGSSDTVFVPTNNYFKRMIYPEQEETLLKSGDRYFNLSEGFSDHLLIYAPILSNEAKVFVTSCQFLPETEKVYISFPVVKNKIKMSVSQEFSATPEGALIPISGTLKYN